MSPRKRKSSGSGGPRTGTPGSSYSNRTDLPGKPTQPVTVASGQQYGSRQAQVDAQRAVPLPAAAPPPAPQAAGTVTAGPITPLDAPTALPNQPVTHGLPVGAGAGPEVLGLEGSSVLDALRGIYAAFPDEDVRAMIEQLEIQGRA